MEIRLTDAACFNNLSVANLNMRVCKNQLTSYAQKYFEY